MSPDDERHLRRAIGLAMTGRGRVEPNPMVGCVIVRGGRAIGEGCHARFGGPHAEPAALAVCVEPPAGATAYVTLEPCCHTNKKTPPCVPRLIAAGIARVVVGCLDPNPAVDGNGVRALREAGVTVDGPLLEPECRQLIAPFLLGRPYVTLKWAESADGKIAGPGGRRVQIGNPRSSQVVHGLRARCDAIAVGINTVLNDDPLLLARRVDVLRPLRRLVLDSRLRLPLTSQLVRTTDRGPVEVFTRGGDRVDELRGAGVTVHVVDDPLGALLGVAGVTNLMAEPGPTLAASVLPVADRLWVIRSPNPIGDGVPAAPLPAQYVPVGTVDLDGDVLTEYLHRDRMFAPVPSADLVGLTEGTCTVSM